MIVIKDTSRYESIVNEIEASKNNIASIFEKATENMKKIDDTDTWTGLAQKEFSNKYNQLASNYDAIKNGIDTYIRFMRQAEADYKEIELQTRSNVETNGNQFDVNS